MIEEYVKEIEKTLVKIKEENNENINQLIAIETSGDYAIGNMLCAYGRIYKAIFYSKSYEECVQKLEKLKRTDAFDVDNVYDVLCNIEDGLIEKMKKGVRFDTDAQMDAEDTLEHEYIFETILKQL